MSNIKENLNHLFDDYSINQICKILKVSRSTVYRWRNGEFMPDEENERKINRIYDERKFKLETNCGYNCKCSNITEECHKEDLCFLSKLVRFIKSIFGF